MAELRVSSVQGEEDGGQHGPLCNTLTTAGNTGCTATDPKKLWPASQVISNQGDDG